MYTNEQLLTKIDNEGGYDDAMFWRIDSDDIDDIFVAELWSIAQAAYDAYEQALQPLIKKLNDIR